MPPLTRFTRRAALLVLVFWMLLAAPAMAAGLPKPIVVPLLPGQSVEVHSDPLKIKVATGLHGPAIEKAPDIALDLILLRCESTLATDGVVECGTRVRPAVPTPSVPMPEGRRRQGLRDQFENDVVPVLGERILPFDEAATRAYANLMATTRALGRPMGILDGQIAAICLTNNCALATRNVRDFDATGLDLVNPWGS